MIPIIFLINIISECQFSIVIDSFIKQFQLLGPIGADSCANYGETNFYSSYRKGEFDEEREQLHVDEVESEQDEDEDSDAEEAELTEKPTLERLHHSSHNQRWVIAI